MSQREIFERTPDRRHLPDGRESAGEFLAIESPTYLEYTWIWAEPAAPGEPKYTFVKVSFRDLGDERTEIVLTHEGFVDPEDRDDHTSGWTSILDHLASALGTTRPGA